jgi:hypothetical protein
MKILNAFSFNMVGSFPVTVTADELTLEEAQTLAQGGESAVGHPDTARVFQGLLGVPVPAQRVTVSLAPGDIALVGQYRGPRLAEGATELPEGATIQWLSVRLS